MSIHHLDNDDEIQLALLPPILSTVSCVCPRKFCIPCNVIPMILSTAVAGDDPCDLGADHIDTLLLGVGGPGLTPLLTPHLLDLDDVFQALGNAGRVAVVAVGGLALVQQGFGVNTALAVNGLLDFEGEILVAGEWAVIFGVGHGDYPMVGFILKRYGA